MKTSETGILLYAKGEAFEGGKYDLRSLERILSNYRLIIDHVLPLVVGQKTLTDRIRSDVKYEIEIGNGSVEIILNFIVEHPELLAVLSYDGGYALAEAVAKIIHYAVELRRALTKILDNGLRPRIQIDNSINIDNSVTHNITTGDIHINNPQYIVAADQTKAPLDRLIRSIDGSYVSDISLAHKNLSTRLSVNDHEITGTQQKEISSYIEVLGRLDMAAFQSHRGHIITGSKHYPVTWDEQIRPKIREFVDREGIIFRVRPIVDQRQFHGEPIGFHLIDCWEPQRKMNL